MIFDDLIDKTRQILSLLRVTFLAIFVQQVA
jgi:hypothetical protein